MAESRSLPARLGRTWQNVRTKGTWPVVRTLLARAGLRVTPYYWMREMLPIDLPAHLSVLPEGFTFREIGEEQIAGLNKLGSAEDGRDGERLMRHATDHGYRCLGIMRGDEVVAFTSFATDVSHSLTHQAVMGPNEVYLFNMYVVPEMRGQNLAAILRQKNYELLRAMGRDTCYSITIRENRASLRFKEKLGAKKVLLGVCVQWKGKVVARWVVRRY